MDPRLEDRAVNAVEDLERFLGLPVEQVAIVSSASVNSPPDRASRDFKPNVGVNKSSWCSVSKWRRRILGKQIQGFGLKKIFQCVADEYRSYSIG
jgi:hypothetical protein